MSSRADELRREIREMDANKASLDPALFEVMRKSLVDDLADLGETVEEPTPATNRPRLQTTIHTHPAPEPAMPKPEPVTPQARLQQLLDRMRRNDEAGKAPAASLTRLDIRKHCAMTGLEVPAEAAVRPSPVIKPKAEKSGTKKAQRKAARKAVAADPGRLERPLEAAIDLGRAIERHVAKPTPMADVTTRLRGIRRQVWLLMADLEGLTPEQVQALTAELEVLEQATHQAHQLALRAAEAA